MSNGARPQRPLAMHTGGCTRVEQCPRQIAIKKNGGGVGSCRLKRNMPCPRWPPPLPGRDCPTEEHLCRGTWSAVPRQITHVAKLCYQSSGQRFVLGTAHAVGFVRLPKLPGPHASTPAHVRHHARPHLRPQPLRQVAACTLRTEPASAAVVWPAHVDAGAAGQGRTAECRQRRRCIYVNPRRSSRAARCEPCILLALGSSSSPSRPAPVTPYAVLPTLCRNQPNATGAPAAKILREREAAP